MKKKRILFPVGKIIIEKDAIEAAGIDGITDVLNLHESGKWGDIEIAEQRANRRALKTGGTIVSRFDLDLADALEVRTDADRARTFVNLVGARWP